MTGGTETALSGGGWLWGRNVLTRRLVLALPALLAACGSDEEGQANFAPLDFSYLTPLNLNVGSIEIQQLFVPAGMPPDVSQLAPIPPVAALRLMAEQRLRAVGTSGRAVFAIDNASLLQQGSILTGAFSVTLSIVTEQGVRAGFAQATATRQITGVRDEVRAALYSLTRELMQQMNVEFEYQAKRSLRQWLLNASAIPATVEQAPLAPPAPGGPTARPGPVAPPPQPGPVAPPPQPGPVLE